MSYLVVENFSAGLDTRRHPLTARAGTLQKLDNAHISRGGEIEKRKAFVEFANLGDSVASFGMEATADTIYVFGSYPGSWSAPAGITFQRLDHPDGLLTSANYVNEIIYSTLYGGKPFVIAKFGTGDVYPFYDGVIIDDFVNGIIRSSMASSDFYYVREHLRAVVNKANNGYVATAGISGPGNNQLIVTGKPGVKFTPSATVDAPVTVTVATTQQSVDAVAETLSAGSFTISSGSNGNASIGRDLRNNIATLPGITGLYINGVEILGLGSPVFYNTIPQHASGEYNEGPRMAWTLCYLINQTTSTTGFSATYAYYKLSGNDVGTITIKSDPKLGSAFNGKLIEIEFVSDPSNTDLVSSPHYASPYNAGRFVGDFGTLAGGVENAITSVMVDGIEVLGSTVHWATSNTDTSLAVSTAINTFTSLSEFTASVSAGSVVLKGLAGTGKTPNGKRITVSAIGDVAVTLVKPFDGGKDAVAAVPQISTYTLGGTFTVGAKITLIATPDLDPTNPFYWGATRVANTSPVAAMTFKSKEHVISGSSLFFSGVNQPTMWGFEGTGSGFINMSNNFGGNEVLTGLALYQGYLAAFARRSVQVWKMDPDPALNAQGQVINNTGSIAKKSIVSVGEIDVFYLSDSGVRSLRARDASNAAMVNDVGTPIDSLVLADLAGMTEDQKSKCCAIIEPIDGRYWLAVGDKVYVYSYFPSGQVAAWSTYHPGFSISKFTTKDGLIYARAGNKIYVYGGTNGTTYDSSAVELILPYLDGGKPAHQKTFNGIDLTVQGEWSLFAGMDPLVPDARELVATVDKPTFSLDRVAASGMGTHLGLRFTNQSPGYARLANLIAHFELNDAS